MRELTPFIVVGVTAGSLYGLAGMGLTLTYKATGVFNFAHGAVAAAAAFAFYTLHQQWHVPWPVALIVAVAFVGVVAGVVVERVTRRLIGDPVASVVATVGLLLTLQGLIQWRYGAATRQLNPFIKGTAMHVAGVAVSAQQAVAVVVAAAGAVGLFAFFRVARIGTHVRAVVDAPELLDLTGTSPNRVRTVAWIIGAVFAALSGVLIAPFLGLDATLLTLLVVQAFGAVAIGRFSGLLLTYGGGVALGVGASLLTKAVAGRSGLGGLPSSLPFIVLVAALIVWPPRRVTSSTRQDDAGAAGERRRWSPATIAAVVVGGAVVILAIPSVVGTKLPTFTTGAAFVVVFVSLALLMRTAGQTSLCHAAFVAVGAAMFAHFSSATGLGLPWFVALLLAGLAVVPVGALVAIPAIRLSGVHLALATFGFAILMERVVYPTGAMFGGVGFRQAPRPSFAHGDTALFFVVAGVAAAACALVVVITRTRLGRLLRGLAESPEALTANGLSVNVTRVVVFAAAAFLAGIAGALFAASSGSVSGQGFGSFNSLLYVVVLAVAGRALVPSAVIAAAALAVAPAYLPDAFVRHQALLFGVATVAVVVGTHIRVRAPGAVDRLARGPVRARLVEAGATT